MSNPPPKKSDARKKRKGKPSTTTTSTSTSASKKGPNEAELKLLRARYQNKYNAFAGEIGHSDDPNQRDHVVRVPTARRRPSHSPIIASSPIDDGLAPTVFEQVNGGFRPARTRLRHRDIFKLPPWAKQFEMSERTKSESSEPASEPTLSETVVAESQKRKKKAAKKSREKERDAKRDIPLAEKAADSLKLAEAPPKELPVGAPVAAAAEEKKPTKETTDVKPKTPVGDLLYGDVVVPTKMPPPEPAAMTAVDGVSPVPSTTSAASSSAVSSTSVTSVESGRFTGKKGLFDSVGDEIVLDDKILQEIASDLQKGVQFNPDVVDLSLANKLVEIKKRQENVSDADLKQMTEQPYEIDETANKVVEALTSRNVLAKVLDAEELKVLSEYFSGSRPQDEKVLDVLNTALEKILERATEFYANEKELVSFTENRDRAKMRLLDALLSRRAGFLSNLYSNAFVYANYLRDKMANAYQAAAHTYKVANVVAEQSMAAATDAVVFSKEALGRSAVVAGEAVAYSKDAINRSAAVASDAVAYSKDTLEKSAIAAREMAQKSHEFVVTARDRVAKAGEVGQGLIDTARSWTSSLTSGGPSSPTSPTPTASDILLAGERTDSDETKSSTQKMAAEAQLMVATAVEKLAELANESTSVPNVVLTAVEANSTPAADPIKLPATAVDPIKLPMTAVDPKSPVTAVDPKSPVTTAKTRSSTRSSSSDNSMPPSPTPATAVASPAKRRASRTQLTDVHHEHWLVTLWKVISALIHLPFLLLQQNDANDTRTDRTNVSNLRSSSILVPRRPKAKKEN